MSEIKILQKQITDRPLHQIDLNFGFRKKNSELDNILLGDGVKMISKIYKLLLKWDTEDEVVKTQMVSWADNFDKEITLASWEHLWENCY